MSTPLPRVRASALSGRGWLNTGGRDLDLADLRGKIVLLDFWTFCCLNCLHVLDELRELEERYPDVLVVIGVHSPKFTHEADPDALAAAVQRYEVAHPVLDDPDLVTWSAYTARAWPTLVLIDPEGYIVAHMAGEGHAPHLASMIEDLITEHESGGTLHRGDGPYVPPDPPSGTLSFPAKAITLPGGNLLVADAGHHSLAELAPDGQRLVRRIGSGQRGRADGGPDMAQFSEPNGLCLVPPELRSWLGYEVLVADTVNHLLRGVRLRDGSVRTVCGTGQPYRVGAPDQVNRLGDGVPGPQALHLSSPWDVTWVPALAGFLVAMAGSHSLWEFDDKQGSMWHIGGTMNEGLQDGQLPQAWFAQPSGLSKAPDSSVWLVDAETSALRQMELGSSADSQVRTVIGHGLFDFGHRDGPAGQALLQHPLGLSVLEDGSVVIADTYNGAIRHYRPDTGNVSTVATGLAEPSDVLLADDGTYLWVVESAAHRLTRLALPGQTTGRDPGRGAATGGAPGPAAGGEGEAVGHDVAHQVRRPETEVGTELSLQVTFTPAAGKKLDTRFGQATELSISATPSDLLISGAGTTADLDRRLRLRSGSGVLHVSARAASCDDDPDVEFAACHLAQQDWGVPVNVCEDGPQHLSLPLLG